MWVKFLSDMDYSFLHRQAKGFAPTEQDSSRRVLATFHRWKVAENILPLPLNEERLQKLTEDYVVSNRKLVEVLEEELHVSAGDGLRRTFESF